MGYRVGWGIGRGGRPETVCELVAPPPLPPSIIMRSGVVLGGNNAKVAKLYQYIPKYTQTYIPYMSPGPAPGGMGGGAVYILVCIGIFLCTRSIYQVSTD